LKQSSKGYTVWETRHNCPMAGCKSNPPNPSRPYGSSGLLPVFIAQVDAYP